MTFEKSNFTKTMEAALRALDFAPMVCILFLAARMRSLQMGLEAPQQWARIYFFVGTYGILLHAVLALTQAWVAAKNNAIMVLESITMFAVYVSMGAVIISVFTLEAPEGKETLPISTTVRIVMACTVQYFFVYILLFVFTELHQRKASHPMLRFAVNLFEAAQKTV